MATYENKLTENVPGKWYTDDNCICCGLCGDFAPASFRPSEDGGHHVVHNQPSTPGDEEAAQEAMEMCPVDAIGDDGGRR